MVISRSLSLFLTCAALAGCASSAPIFVEPTAQSILVEPSDNVLLLKGSYRGQLGGAERQRLADFVATASRGRRDALRVAITSMSPMLRHTVARHLRAMGVDPDNVRSFDGNADAYGRFLVRVDAIAYTAIPPICPSLLIVGPSVNDNSFDQTLGCSTRNNLAATVNDPGDLLGNWNAPPPTDGDRAAIPVGRYRSFANNNGASVHVGAVGGLPQGAPIAVPNAPQ